VAVVACVASLAIASGAGAQEVGGTRAGVTRPDSVPGPRPVLAAIPVDTANAPPISPRRAFLLSLAIPGAGQARLNRVYAGGVFLLVEVASLALVHRASEDLRIARSFCGVIPLTVGALLTGAGASTVNWKSVVADSEPSLTVIVTVVMPAASPLKVMTLPATLFTDATPPGLKVAL
jgi:hypothetical protein